MNVKLTGFKWDPRTRVAHFEKIIPGEDGLKRRRMTIRGVTRPEALHQWSEFRQKALSELKEPETFGGYIERYGTRLLDHLSVTARVKDESRVRCVLLPFFGNVKLSNINLTLVKDFVSHLKNVGFLRVLSDGTSTRRPYSAPSINNALSVLRKILHDAVDRGAIAAYPIRGRLPREKEVELHLEMAPDEKSRFLAAFHDEEGFRALIEEEYRQSHADTDSTKRWRPTSEAVGEHFRRFRDSKRIYVVALETGLRKGDLLHLPWTSVKPDRITVVMKKTSEEAVIPKSMACEAALHECLDRPKVGALVFLNDEGHPFSETTLRRYYSIAKKLAGITRRCRFHDLRHTFGSTLASEEDNPLKIKRAFGHTTMKMTERYSRASDKSMHTVAAALDRAAMNSSMNSGGNPPAPQEEPKSFDFKILPGGDRTHDPRLRRPMLLSS
jgi:integrase